MFHDQDLPANTGVDVSIGELADIGASPLPAPGAVTRPDDRPILLPQVTPFNTEEYRSDRADILDMVRKHIEERKLKPKDRARPASATGTPRSTGVSAPASTTTSRRPCSTSSALPSG